MSNQVYPDKVYIFLSLLWNMHRVESITDFPILSCRSSCLHPLFLFFKTAMTLKYRLTAMARISVYGRRKLSRLRCFYIAKALTGLHIPPLT